LNWNGKLLLEQLLNKVVEYSLTPQEDVEVVVADNGSSDGSLAFVQERFPHSVRCIDLKINHGFADGYNLALQQVEAEYVVLLNSDVEVTPGWLAVMTDYLDSHDDVVGCQPKVLSMMQRDHFEHAGASGGYLDALGYPFCRGRVFGVVEADNGQYDQVATIFWATGACFCLRLQAFRVAGGLDARFFAHMEEIDLCWRLRHRGYRLVCLPQSRVYHLGGASLDKSNPRKTFLNYRNNLLMLYKNLPNRRLIPVMLIRFLMDYLSACIFLATGKPGDAKAVFKARVAFWVLRGKLSAQREENRANACNMRIPEVYSGSIVLAFYLMGKKRFSDYF